MFLLFRVNINPFYFLFLFFRFSAILASEGTANIWQNSDDISKTPFQSVEEAEEITHSEQNDEGVENSERFTEGSCRLDVNRDLPKNNEPLLLTVDKMSNTVLVLPEADNMTGIITLKDGEELLVACPGSKNYVEKTHDNFIKVVCNYGEIFSGSGAFQNLDCHSRPEAAEKVTNSACAGGKGAIVEIGFEFLGWTKLIEACHNFLSSSTFYSIHTVHGSRLNGKVHWTAGRPSFAKGDGELFRGINPDQAYTQKNQHSVFEDSLGEERAEEMLSIASGSYLVRGLLAPDADFLLSPHQLLTYSYVNAAPQWHTISSGSWLRLQEHIRQIASRLEVDLEVVTGTSGVLRLQGEKGTRKITLLGSKIPVPEFFWKIIRNTRDDSCIAFIASNNPFAKQKPRRLCKDVCASTFWPVYQSDYSHGYVYCCEYARIKRTLRDIPLLQCNSSFIGFI